MLALALLTGACRGGEAPATPVPDSVYVEVMARLVLVDSAFGSSDGLPPGAPPADSVRARILERWGVKGEDLLSYARTRGDDPTQMQAIWRRIRDLSDSLDTAGWSAPTSPRDTAPAGPRPRQEAPPDTGADASGPDSVGAASPDTVAAAAP